jgi:hypothetical protein
LACGADSELRSLDYGRHELVHHGRHEFPFRW